MFSLINSGFGITRGKDTSARVVLWRQFGLSQVYTMEATYCGFDSGCYIGSQVFFKSICFCLKTVKAQMFLLRLLQLTSMKA